MTTTFKTDRSDYKIIRRTFEAAKHPKGSAERARLNLETETSEYMTSYRYAVKFPNTMTNGLPNPVQPFHFRTFKTKQEAQAWI